MATRPLYSTDVCVEQKLFEHSPLHPGDILRHMIEDKGWTQDELALITGRSRQAINEILSRRTGITPEMAVTLATVFGNSASDWMKWDAAFRLANVEDNTEDVRQKVRLYELAPIRDMQKRAWIKDTKDPAELEKALKAFFGIESLEEEPLFPMAMRRRSTLAALNAAERAWCFRARQMASALRTVARFIPESLDNAQERLRELAAYPTEARHIPKILAEHGIRFVVVEPLPDAKIDGAAFWLDDESPVIAVSVRYDRIDAFWFTVMHEFMHIKNRDALSVDNNLFPTEDQSPVLLEDESERRANEQAAASLIPAPEIDSFIRRVSPLYSKNRIVQFAHRLKIHPGIIVGQLQHRGELGYGSNREMLAKIRSVVIQTALTDGWGRMITEGIL